MQMEEIKKKRNGEKRIRGVMRLGKEEQEELREQESKGEKGTAVKKKKRRE